ncbi:hypothetical protein Pmar_PMAR008712 [Perkinsus marinus ATCC 50983]|uniref:SH3 domain-containing protein n=1 Tax=Perkinsus marinus (strain ATCC 50983 / TXsc) TaxID=423536 RepID=C5L0T0_PERM5|nr:hypothetical protein Pmar_PMAR008712 [Perkinsus marinus ATCC 50983]EER09572.1 hypothetical protein Pmar_PMAR008712 [Perkinsus marinus ATCC 50983]|eukprot:XP_002777777.1 hypothetical protein Pmar_PMAR008712 [Perkinsus marinus ATCC 50983]
MYPGKQQRHGTPPRISPREMAELEDQIVARLKGHLDYRLEGLRAFIADEVATAKNEIMEALERGQSQRQSPRTAAAYGALDDYALARRPDERRTRVSSRPVRSLEAAGFYGRGQADLLEDGPGLRALPMDLPRKPRERPKIPVVDDDDGPQRVAAPIVAPRQDISAQTSTPLISVDHDRQPHGEVLANGRPMPDVDEVTLRPPERIVHGVVAVHHSSMEPEDVRGSRRVKSASTERSSGSTRSPGLNKGSRYMRVTNDFVAEDVIELSIKAGDRVEVNESRPDWTNVTGVDGQAGWVPTSHLEPDD